LDGQRWLGEFGRGDRLLGNRPLEPKV
jgi:hypothetical protein